MLYFRFYFSLQDLFVSKPNKNMSMVWNDHCFERMNGQAQNNIRTVQLFLLSLRIFFSRKKRDIPRIFLCYYAVSFLGQTSKFIVFTKFESRDRKFFWKSTFNWWSLNLLRNYFVGSTKKSCLRSNYRLFIYRPFLW